MERGVRPTVNSYSTIIDKLAKGGDIDAAEDWLARMTDAGIVADVVSYSMILSAYSRAGDVARARSLFERMKERGVQPNTVCFNLLINVLRVMVRWVALCDASRTCAIWALLLIV